MKSALFVIVLSITVLSCSKDPVNDSSKRDALTTGSWKLTASMTDYEKDGQYEENSYALFEECSKDNLYSFQTDGNGIMDEGPTKCEINYPQTRPFSWSFSDNQSRFHRLY